MMKSTMTTLPSDLLAATEDLANHLLASELFTAYHAAHGRFNADAGARALLQRLSQSQAELRQKQARGTVTQSDVDQLKALQSAVQADRTIADYAGTQQAAIGFLREINQAISELIGVDFAALAKRSGCC
jgi:cell fate (sporulation/competence/biofilm development) regulator YlbF (YheA/YmcA/DUF963 family)